MKYLSILAFLTTLLCSIFAQPHNPAEYAEWKNSLVPHTKSTMMIGPIENDYVAVQLNDEGLSGDYGSFNIGTSSTYVYPDATLIFSYPGTPGTSHTIFKIDGSHYSPHSFFSGCTTLMTADIPFNIYSLPGDSSYIEGGWIIDDITIYQKLQPVYIENAHGDITGTIYIKYTIINNGTSPHTVGVLLELDTMVGHNDAAPLATSYGYAAVEQEFLAPSIPPYYQAGEEDYPWNPTDLVAAGYLAGWDAVCPDRFLVGSWSTYTSVIWDYTPSFGPYGDSAVLLYWYPRTVAPGETTYVATYYGLGLPERTPPDAMIVLPTEYDTVACDDQWITIAAYDSSGIDSTSFVITVNGSTFTYPDHITFSRGADTAYFTWQPDPGFFTEDCETVFVSVDSVADVWGTNILSPLQWHFIVDQLGPEVVSYSLDTGAIVSNLQQPIDIGITDNFSGIYDASIVVHISTRSGIDQDIFPGSGLTWDGLSSTLHIDPASAGITYQYNDSIHIEVVQCLDLAPVEYCGPNNIQPNGFWFFITNPPDAEFIVPPESVITACPDQKILIDVRCSTEIISDSIRLYVNGNLYRYGDPEMIYPAGGGNIIQFEPSPGNEFGDGPVIVRLLPLYDIYGAPGDTVDWMFYVDVTPPAISNENPPAGSEVQDLSFDISFTLNDTGPDPNAISGLDTNSVRVVVLNSAGANDITAHLNRSGNNFTVNTDYAGLSFIDDEIVTVQVTCADSPYFPNDSLYCPPNQITHEWSFKIAATPCSRSVNPITPDPQDTYNDETEFTFPNIRSTTMEKKIFIYDRTDHLVRTIDEPTDGKWIWNGRDDNGNVVPQGIYIYIISVDGEVVCNGTISVMR